MDVSAFLDLCYQVTRKPEYKAQWENGEIIRTFCNEGLNDIAGQGFGFTGFQGLLANDCIALMRETWKQVEMLRAWGEACKGNLVVACVAEQPHGHVAVVAPKNDLVQSKNMGCSVCWVANVGKDNGIIGLNWAFRLMPEFYLYGGG